jgi:hypothetical protein
MTPGASAEARSTFHGGACERGQWVATPTSDPESRSTFPAAEGFGSLRNHSGWVFRDDGIGLPVMGRRFAGLIRDFVGVLTSRLGSDR